MITAPAEMYFRADPCGVYNDCRNAFKPMTTYESPTQTRDFRFSGHQSFALRIAWIPKAVREINAGRDPLTNSDDGIASLGLGKNMVESLRCWIEAFGVAGRGDTGWDLTPIGAKIFGLDGLDPYLDDPSTSWVLHWMICTNAKTPFWAWECMFNRWLASEFTATEVLEVFTRQAASDAKTMSPVTLKQHWEVFLHTYRPPRGGRGDDHLDSAMSILGLIREIGERPNALGKWEPLYSFDTGPKVGIPQELFAYFIHDWWNAAHEHEQTVTLREVVSGVRSPGRVLKMQEPEILRRLADLAQRQPKIFEIIESASLRQLRRRQKRDGLDDLARAYRLPHFLV